MVVDRTADVAEADAGQARALEDREVGVVRQQLVDFVVERARGRPRQRPCHHAGDPGIAATGLEEEARSVGAARFHIDHRGGPAQRGRIGDEAFRSEECHLFRVGDQIDDRVAEVFLAQRPGGLHERGDADAVVGDAGTGRNGVVVRGQDQRIRPGITGDACNDVCHRRAGDIGAAGKRSLDGDVVAQLAETGGQAVADRIVSRGADGMRHIAAEDLALEGDGPRCGEGRWRLRLRQRGGAGHPQQ